MRSRHLLYVICLFSGGAFAQSGGGRSFEFLQVPSHARLAGLGGVNISLADRDPNFFLSNPAAVGDSLTHWASASYQHYVADVAHSVVTYRPSLGRWGSLGIGIIHFSYGSLDAYDPTGVDLGTFNASETAVVISKSHQVNHFRFGLNLKGVFSGIGAYRSSALMADLGGLFVHPSGNFTAGLVFRNMGVVLSPYTDFTRPALPFDVQVGTTFRPTHMPLRFSITAYNLARSLQDDFAGQVNDPSALDKVLGHFTFGVEVLLHRAVNVLLGYNRQVHTELRQEETGGGAGLSVGFSARVKAFEFTFSRNSYIVGTAGYTFGLAANTGQLFKRIAQ